MKNIYFKSFTIAETLTALVILGILIAMTMPMVYNAKDKNVTQTNFVDIMNVTNKALLNYTVKNHAQGKLSMTNLFSSATVAENLSSVFALQAKTNCWNGKTIYRNYDSTGTKDDLNNLSCIIDDKIRIYAFETISTNCDADLRADTTIDNKLKKSCGYVYFDINGEQAPNTFGKDVFKFVITDSSPNYLYPFGGQFLKNDIMPYWKDTSCNSNNKEGRSCAGRIIEENMKIRYW